MTEQSSNRQFERVLSNILPYRATSIRSPIVYDPLYSEPFEVSELIAIRDEPNSMFYLAVVTDVTSDEIVLHYLVCTNHDISKAIFRFSWHLPSSNTIVLSNLAPIGTIAYSGTVRLESVRNLLVARNLELTSKLRLKRKSQKILHHIYDELFIYNR